MTREWERGEARVVLTPAVLDAASEAVVAWVRFSARHENLADPEACAREDVGWSVLGGLEPAMSALAEALLQAELGAAARGQAPSSEGEPSEQREPRRGRQGRVRVPRPWRPLEK
ncbi:hypothetical protein GCM10023146_40930 [Nocardioides caricicola]